VYVRFHVKCLKSEGEKENEFQLFLILSESSCKECGETSARSVLTKVQCLSLKAQEGIPLFSF
jgi:predicted metal-binding protein